VGCLLEIRADAGYPSESEVDLLFRDIDRAVAGLLPLRRVTAVVDWRRCRVMSPGAAERMVQRVAATNSRTVRSAALARPDAPSAVLQFLRVIREAGMPDRRLFHDAEELVAWLGEVLSEPEVKRLRAFLDGRERSAFARPSVTSPRAPRDPRTARRS